MSANRTPELGRITHTAQLRAVLAQVDPPMRDAVQARLGEEKEDKHSFASSLFSNS